MKAGQSIFITSPGGCGKTKLLQEMIQDRRQRFPEGAVAVCAPTGPAAFQLQGVTLDRLMGLSPTMMESSRGKPELLIDQILSRSHVYQELVQLQVLFVDEVSMISYEKFALLDLLLQRVKNTLIPFGKVQLVLSGDFCQLPPISDKSNDEKNIRFIFESDAWKRLFPFPRVVVLKTIYRQREDQVFQLCLNELRFGVISKRTEAVFKQRTLAFQRLPLEQRNELLHLKSSNSQVEAINKRVADSTPFSQISRTFYAVEYVLERSSLEHLQSEYEKTKSFQRTDRYAKRLHAELAFLLKEHNEARERLPDRIDIYLSSRQMLRVNLSVERGLVNGACGTVIGFQKCTSTFETRHPNTSEFTAKGRRKKRRTEPDIYASFHYPFDEGVFPIVQFDHGPVVIIKNYVSTLETSTGLHCRMQVPLTSCSAITIHKSQGMSVSRAVVDISKCFASGQAYVGLSRLQSLQGLYLENWNKESIRVHPRIVAYYKELEIFTFLTRLVVHPSLSFLICQYFNEFFLFYV
jgi:ATP-dependent DNA helicase PIF1